MLAVIPARGGSKGVPRKNIRLLNNKPLICYTINAAIDSRIFSKVIVSTDNEEIADIAKENGAEVPFIRPESLSNDYATSDSVIKHALDFYLEQGIKYDVVCKLQPTSPLRTAEDIIGAYSLFKEKKAEFVVSVCECEHTPLWSGRLDDTLSMRDFLNNINKSAGRQELPTYYRLNGAIYIGRVDAFVRNGSFISDSGYAYIMKQLSSVDIDNELDFKIAETIMETCYAF